MSVHALTEFGRPKNCSSGYTVFGHGLHLSHKFTQHITVQLKAPKLIKQPSISTLFMVECPLHSFTSSDTPFTVSFHSSFLSTLHCLEIYSVTAKGSLWKTALCLLSLLDYYQSRVPIENWQVFQNGKWFRYLYWHCYHSLS